jgi:hypothetical protein
MYDGSVGERDLASALTSFNSLGDWYYVILPSDVVPYVVITGNHVLAAFAEAWAAMNNLEITAGT